MDLADLLSTEEAVWYTLEHPVTYEPLTDDKGNLMRVALLGPDSAPAKAVEQKISADMLQRVSKSRRGRLDMTSEMTESHARRRFMARVSNWENLVLGKKPFVYNDENKTKLCDDPAFGPIKRQIEAALGDDQLFIKQANSPSD